MTHRFYQNSCRCRRYSAGDAIELKWEFDKDLGRYYVRFLMISSGAQLGVIGAVSHVGFSFIFAP